MLSADRVQNCGQAMSDTRVARAYSTRASVERVVAPAACSSLHAGTWNADGQTLSVRESVCAFATAQECFCDNGCSSHMPVRYDA